MIITDWIHAIAGFFILFSLALGVEVSPIFHSKYWLFFTAFVGLNLLQFGFSSLRSAEKILSADLPFSFSKRVAEPKRIEKHK